MSLENRYVDLEQKIGYTFQDKKHLDVAFTHKSYTNEKMVGNFESYERYEFLGDAVLELAVSKYLFEHYPEKSEGELTKIRASLVCEYTLSKIARDLGYGEYGRFSKGERNTGGPSRDSILCDMFESVLGAIFLDSNMDVASAFVEKFLLTDIEHKARFHDSKSKLQEYAQKKKVHLEYKLLEEYGPDHNKEFMVQVFLDEQGMATGQSHTIKAAEQIAAYETLLTLRSDKN